MAHEGLLDRVIAITGNERNQAYKAIIAAFGGQMALALSRKSHDHRSFTAFEILATGVHTPPPVGPYESPALPDAKDVTAHIAHHADIPHEDAAKVLGLVTEAFVGNSFEAGLRLTLPRDTK